ncbi:membrane-bound lytic murein transglycosylase MltF [Sulfuriferula thiophila]|uniref:membrane-bound lytic murein transglycosylase MltF n=1 Tax=Sulfuriferula thiophila TaxID=1781211 RepID=UPI000F607B77|nr:membrane-bound lytic murein transglycosylase MltF [Sulfuriferula thiophila]
MRILLFLFTLILAGCDMPNLPPVVPHPIAAPAKSGELVVLTHNGPTTYYEGADGKPSGFEYDLVTLFAQEYGYKVRFVETANLNEMFTLLSQHQAHFAAAGISALDSRKTTLQFGPPYLTVNQQVIYNTDGVKPRNFSDLKGLRVEVVAGTSHVETLRKAARNVPGLKWQEMQAKWDEESLDRLSRGEVDAVLVDSNEFDIARKFYTNLDAAFEVPQSDQLAWAFPKISDPLLLKQTQQFFQKIHRDGTLKQIVDRYYGHADRLEGADVAGFLDKMQSVLPKFRKFFQEGQSITGIDWRLLAAIGYQESHWDPFATSPTGVRGLMMMTSDTADRMGVDDRLNARQSILGGARYLALLVDQMSLKIEEPDRTWMALAAYNQGQGHLEDARILAQRRKLNPSAWCDIKQTMPLLGSSVHNATVKHGFCRGGEAVIFVENIRTYYDILVKYEKPYKPLLMSKND